MRSLYADRCDEAVQHLSSWPEDLRDFETRLVREAEACQELAALEASD